MKQNRYVFFLLSAFFSVILYGQDVLPRRLKSEKKVFIPRQAKDRNTIEKILVTNPMPGSFLGIKDNVIDSAGHLAPVFERLSAIASAYGNDTVRILQIGDSHIRGHIFPRATGESLVKSFGAVSYTDMGINGATCLTFTHSTRIADVAALKPDLLIMSFGTNESHGRGYSSLVHYHQMDELVGLLRDSLPGIPILMTTPAGSYESFRRKRKKRNYAVNPRTVTAVETIKEYARRHKIAVWDLYNLVGGKEKACLNWQAAKMMRPDHVHYMPEGYRLQGELLYEAIIKAYNDYVSR